MKSKKLVALALLAAISVGGGKAYAQLSENKISKNKLMTEKVVNQVSDINGEDKLKEIVLNSFEKYFNEKVDVKKSQEDVQSFKAEAEWNSHGKDYFTISWMNEEKAYYANLEENGEIFDIGFSYNNSQEVDLIDLEEAKKIALDFIKEKKLVDDVDSIEFLGEATIHWSTCGVVFKNGEDKGILVSVDSAKKVVKHFSLMTTNDAKKCVENTDYRESGLVG